MRECQDDELALSMWGFFVGVTGSGTSATPDDRSSTR